MRVIDADIAAAFLAREADAEALAGSNRVAEFKPRCENNLPAAFEDVVSAAVWTPPMATPANDDVDPPILASLVGHAQCAVTLRTGLGG